MSHESHSKESSPENGAQLEEKTKLEVFRIAWRENTLSYRKALKTARSDYFSSLLEQNKHNPRYLFNTVAKLTKNTRSDGGSAPRDDLYSPERQRRPGHLDEPQRQTPSEDPVT